MSSQRSRFTRARVLIVGAPQVGKTAFAVRYLTRRFIGEYDHNKEMTYSQKISLDKDDISLELMDIASLNLEDAALVSHMRWADGLIFMYAVTDRQSFTRLAHYFSLLDSIRSPSEEFPSFVIVGNKTDLEHARKVTHEEGESLARRMDCPLLEISTAESPDGVMEAMIELLRHVKRDFAKSQATLRLGPFNSVKRVLQRKITRSKSDTFQ